MKNTLYNIKVTLAIVLAWFTMSSCLDKEPSSAIPINKAMQTYEDAEQTVTGIYALLKSSSLFSGYLTLLPDIQTDLVYAVDGYTNVYGNFWQWDIRPTNAEIESVYAGLYSVISNCNFYLENIGKVVAKQTDDDRITTLEYYTGEVYTIRALAYSELLKNFCKAYDPATAANELGVVLRKKYSEKEPARRASLYDSYQFVLGDLAKAEELLDEEYDSYSSYYITQGVAHALHARVALNMQDWDNAIKYSSKLIDHKNNAYSLSAANVAYTGGLSFFDYMWQYDLGTEVIWQLGFTTTSYGGALGQVFLNFNNDYTYYYPDYVPAQWVLDLYSSSDMRYRAYFADFTTGYDHNLTWPLLVKYYGNQEFMSVSPQYCHITMPKPFRLAEQYLIRAEAYCRKSEPNYALASKDLAALRDTRFVSGGSVALTEANCIQAIAEERVRELYMEGFRLNDLKRWGKLYNNGEGFERKPQSNTLEEGSSLKIKADHPLFVWPIPQHEIEAPGSEVQPNESNK
ncbi:MAG: RagB/SusD family nutrient uptake outer membrane protein [Alistipes sp.]|nr:RagB/SusD family nutrient uptake outer membrane protein [Alistipes sp.]